MNNNSTIHFAHGVNDQMSFNEAFSAARQEVGPGGAFVWHGTVYGTYYGSEWNAMSSSEQHAFTSDAVYTYHHQDEVGGHSPAKIDEPTPPTPPVSHEPKVSVIAVDPDYAIDEETHVGIGLVEIDGIQVMFIDIDQDGVFDISMVDENQNGVFDENEIQLEESGITVSDLQHIQEESEPVKITPVHHVPDGVEVVAVVSDVEITEDGDHGNVGIANVNGVETLLIDVDMNGTFDVAMGDFNQDGQISEEEMVMVDNPQLTVQNFEQELQGQQNGVDVNGNLVAYNNTPDYTNHADVADFDSHLA